MLFTFAGSSHNKYTGYLLDMIAFLELEGGHREKPKILMWPVIPREGCKFPWGS